MSRSQIAAQLSPPSSPDQRARAGSEAARRNWKRVGEIARRAGGDDPDDLSNNEDEMSPEEREEHRKKKAHQRAEREKMAKMMDLQYFLEMVDQKHRYGSNLRVGLGVDLVGKYSCPILTPPLRHTTSSGRSRTRGRISFTGWMMVKEET